MISWLQSRVWVTLGGALQTHFRTASFFDRWKNCVHPPKNLFFNKGSARNDISFRPTFRTPVLGLLRTMRIDCGLHGIALVISNH